MVPNNMSRQDNGEEHPVSLKACAGPTAACKAGIHRPLMPRDVVVIGWLNLVGGILGFVAAGFVLGGVTKVKGSWDTFVFFGLVHVTSEVGVALRYLIAGAACVVAGAGLLRGRWWGWWMMVILMVEGISLTLIRPSVVWIPAFAIGINGAFLAWLAFRARLFHPFGRRSFARKLPVADAGGQDAPRVPSAGEDKME